MNLKSLIKSALNSLFGLGPDLIQPGTYIRPASFSSALGLTFSAEIAAPVQMLVATIPSTLPGLTGIPIVTDKVLIRAAELTLITSPTEGDYIIRTSDNQRLDVITAQTDFTGELWTFAVARSLNQDWGDLTTHSTAEDFGDLTAATTSDDWGTLFA